MGLTLTPDDHVDDGPYLDLSCTSFNIWRRRLAAADGIELLDMEGYGGGRSWSTVGSILRPLLEHSDHDGELTVEECVQILPRLSDVVTQWAEVAVDDEEFRRPTEIGRDFIAVLKSCIDQGVRLLFC